MFTLTSGYEALSTLPIELFAYDGPSPHGEVLSTIHDPGDRRHVLRHAPEDFAVELLDNLRPSLLPPDRRARHLAAVLQRQDFRKVRVRVRERLVVVGVIGRRFVAARPWPEGGDAELLLHVLVIGSSGGRVGVWRRTAWRRTAWRQTAWLRRCLRRGGSWRGCRLLLGSRHRHRRACGGRHPTSPDRPDAPRRSHDHHPIEGTAFCLRVGQIIRLLTPPRPFSV